jgi:hypothetical protein
VELRALENFKASGHSHRLDCNFNFSEGHILEKIDTQSSQEHKGSRSALAGRRGMHDYFQFIVEAYSYGKMDGEAMFDAHIEKEFRIW